MNEERGKEGRKDGRDRKRRGKKKKSEDNRGTSGRKNKIRRKMTRTWDNELLETEKRKE